MLVDLCIVSSSYFFFLFLFFFFFSFLAFYSSSDHRYFLLPESDRLAAVTAPAELFGGGLPAWLRREDQEHSQVTCQPVLGLPNHECALGTAAPHQAIAPNF